MRVSRLNRDDDWTFGKGRANYATRSAAIGQNLRTRIRSFTQDWFADVNDGIPWIELLGQKGTQPRILRQLEARVLATEGVRRINRLRVRSIDEHRRAVIELSVTDIFDAEINEVVSVI